MTVGGVTIDPQGIGVVGLVVLFGVALARGWLVTAREHQTVIHDRDEWRAESRLRDQEISEKNEQLRHVAEVGLTMKQVLSAIQNLTHRRGDEEAS